MHGNANVCASYAFTVCLLSDEVRIAANRGDSSHLPVTVDNGVPSIT